jgi:hypothetical protein
MIRQYTFILCSLFFLCASAQSWCPPGAEWIFRYDHEPEDELSPALVGNVHVQYTGDTVLGGFASQKLEQWLRAGEVGMTEQTLSSLEPIFTRFEQDVVYLWDGSAMSFDTLMWFAAQPGDHWTPPQWENIRFEVLQATTILNEGVELRQLIISIIGPDGEITQDYLTERAGYHYFHFIPINSLFGAVDWIHALRCYRDDELLFHLVAMSACNFFVQVPSRHNASLIPIHPNPGTDHFTLQLQPGPHQLTLFDAQGRQVIRQQLSEERPVISTSSLPSGLYHIHITDGHGRNSGHRWNKE